MHTKALKKLDLHRNDFQLPSSFALREMCLEDLLCDMLRLYQHMLAGLLGAVLHYLHN